MLTPNELRYLAGFFDGEGSVGLYYRRTTKQWRPSVEIAQAGSQKVEQLFNRWALVFGAKVYCSRPKDQLPRMRFVLGTLATMQDFLTALLPYAQLKARQIIILSTWLETRENSYRTAQLLKALKRAE